MFPVRLRAEALRLEDDVLRNLLRDARGWIARYAGPRSDIDDLVQESMIEVVAAFEKFRGDASIRTYARRIVIRTTARELSKRRASMRLTRFFGATEEPIGPRNPEAEITEREVLRRFYRVLERLSERRRNAFVLCAIERLDHVEAAAIAEASVETLRGRLKHARADVAAACARDPLLVRYMKGATHE